MPTIKAILIDDEENSIKSLSYELDLYCPKVEILATFQDPVKAIKGVKELKPDLIFLDIEMPVLNGFDFLDSFETIEFDVIFVTAYDEFAIRAFDFNTTDYLLKPILKDKLIQSIKKVEQRKSHHFPTDQLKAIVNNMSRGSSGFLSSIAIPTSDGFEMISVSDIMYLEAESNYTWVCLENGERLLVSKTLKTVNTMINSEYFFRSHKTFSVNLNFLKKYVSGRGGYLILKNNKQIPVSRSQKSELLKVIGMA